MTYRADSQTDRCAEEVSTPAQMLRQLILVHERMSIDPCLQDMAPAVAGVIIMLEERCELALVVAAEAEAESATATRH